MQINIGIGRWKNEFNTLCFFPVLLLLVGTMVIWFLFFTN